MPLGTEVSLCPGDIVLDRDPAPPPKKRHSPQFSVHVYCGQTAVCVRISLGPEVGLSLGDIVLDGDPAPPPEKRAQSHPIFGPCLLWPNGWMDQGTILGTEVNLYTGDVVLDGVTPLIGAQPPVFGPCLLWLRSAVSATAELLSLITVRC